MDPDAAYVRIGGMDFDSEGNLWITNSTVARNLLMLAPDGTWEEFTLPRKFKGGGGTSFKPVFEWLEQQDQQPDLVVYFTDAEGEFPKHEPQCPVLWLVKGRTKVPWGQRVQLN